MLSHLYNKVESYCGFFFFRLQSWKLCLEGEGGLPLVPPRRNIWEIKHPRPALFNEIHRDLSIDNCMNCGHWLSISFHDFSPKFWHFFWISWILLITLCIVVIISKKVVCLNATDTFPKYMELLLSFLQTYFVQR